MQYIASCSFGKDSLAAIITRMEHDEPIDSAVYCRIMFDDTTSAELPDHEQWIHTHAIPLLKSRYGIETAVVQSETNYCEQFYRQYQKGKNVGRIQGFPCSIVRGNWCTKLKLQPMTLWSKAQGEYTQIVGIAADEPKRIAKQIIKGKILPLVDYGITESEAMEICKKNDLLSPAYNGGRQRLGCWFCHNQRVGELRRLRKEYPALWDKLLELDKASPVTFKPDKTLRDFDRRFFNESLQISLFD